MLDLKAIETELHHARLARIDAEQATTDVEDMIWQVQNAAPGHGRFCFFIEGFEAELA